MKKKTDKAFLLASIAAGVVLGIAEELLYRNKIVDFGGRIPCITLYLFVFAFVMGVIVLFKALRGDAYADFGKIMLLTLAAVAAFVGCSAFFEFLYELGSDKIKEQQTAELQYVFLIDDSGSMKGNDGENKRYDAVETIIRNLSPTNKFAVYTFENETRCRTSMGSENSDKYKFDKSISSTGGGTYMIRAVEKIIDDVCERGDIHTKIIVLTDGYPSDNHFGKYNRMVKECIKKNVSISSVGFGSPDEYFLRETADSTGGTYVFSDNISDLATNLATVVNAKTVPLEKNRDLLGPRFDLTYNSFLYGFLRVLFLILLGILWTIIKLLLVGEKKFMQSSAVLSVALCSLAAILVEVLHSVGFGAMAVRIVFCAMWACTLIPQSVYERTNLGVSLHSEKIGGSDSDLTNDFSTKSQEVGGPKSFL